MGEAGDAGDGAGVCESLCVKQALVMAFFKISNSYANCRFRARKWCNSVTVSGSRAVPEAAATGVRAAFCRW